jgi:hypothetical protein
VMVENRHGQEQLIQEVKSLRNKANMLATCHSILTDRYSRLHSILLSAMLFFSALIVGTTFLSAQFVQNTLGIQPDTLRWIQGLAAIFNFIAGLLALQWDFAGKAAKHREAIRHYTSIVNHARYLLDSGEDITQETFKELRSEYEHTEALPKLPDSEFLRLKQAHLRKVAVSRELEKTPHASIREIRKRLREQEKQGQNDGTKPGV